MNIQDKRKLRIIYAIVCIVLVVVEVIIALFIHDTFVRPYIGDMLVVMVIYAAVRMIIPYGYKLLPLYIFLFATMVECLQYFKIVKILGVENNPLMRTLIGSVFDVKDILSYGLGCVLLGVYEWKRH